MINSDLKQCYICARLACNCFKKYISDLGIKDVYTIDSVSLLVLEQMSEMQVNSLNTQPIFNINTQSPLASNSPHVDSSTIVSALSSLNSKIKNFPNAVVAALAGTIRDNLDTDSKIGGQDDDSLSVIDTMLASLSSKHQDFWKGQG